MTAWLVDRVLPGLVTSAVWAVLLWISHRKLWRRIEKLTNEQTAELRSNSKGGAA